MDDVTENILPPAPSQPVAPAQQLPLAPEPTLPVTTEGMEAFLAGGMVDGIGPVYARRLVEAYGPDTLRRLRDEPESITGIKGFGASRVKSASESLNNITADLDLILLLYSAGVQEMYISRILGKYRKRARSVVEKNPYDMVEDVWRLSFFTADRIGKLLGIAPDDPRRLRGALLTAVKDHAEQGHLFATPEQARRRAAQIAGVEETASAEAAEALIAEGRLVSSRGGYYLPVYYEAERDGAEKLMQLARQRRTPVDDADIPEGDTRGHRYSPRQREAIRMALENPVMILTGGPGSGKTTVLRGILDMLAEEGKNVVLAAPTGRAAKRMSTLTGREASTIHRLLGYRQGEGYFNKTLDADVLVIDEGSMLEQVLFDHLLQAVGPKTKVLVVGDVDQLPAIGAGDVMRDMMRSGAIPTVELTGNFRQAEGSGIAAGAREINLGHMPAPGPAGDFTVIEEKGVKAIHDRILRLVSEELPQSHGILPRDITVVTPRQTGPLGARSLNSDLQKLLNPDAQELRRGLSAFRLGDPVMQTANSRERELYNGETGRVAEIDPEGGWLTVEFADGRRSRYARGELSELTLAYATTVHKLQGSEVEYMVMPVTTAHQPMLYRNLLYTGVSRARKMCVLVGEPDAMRQAVENSRESARNSNFRHRLR